MAAIFVVTACIAPILFRSIYRILKRKLDRSSQIYGKLHCLNNRLEETEKKNNLNIDEFIWIDRLYNKTMFDFSSDATI
jgi:hypothetical protein